MSKVVCPYCFEKFKKSEVKFRCSNYSGNCSDIEDAAMKAFWGEQVKDKPVLDHGSTISSLLGTMPKSAKCKCGNISYKTICPQCHNELPSEMVENGGFIISIIGARSSGKTNYITTLINELRHLGHCVEIGIYDTCVGRKPDEYTSARYDTDFYNKLYKNSECHAQTDVNDVRSKIPLIYKLFSTTKKKHGYLVFYDTAGENFTDTKAIATNAKFLQNSDAIIFLVDTFSIPYVHEKLRSNYRLGEIELLYDKIVSSVIHYFDNNVSRDEKKKHYSKPIALTFSKIDAILKNEDLFLDTSLSGINLNANSQYLSDNYYLLDDVESVSNGICGGLTSWNETQFIENIKAHYGDNAKYFGISALGNMPAGNTIKNLKPYRTMDPLIWILYKLKFPLPIKK